MTRTLESRLFTVLSNIVIHNDLKRFPLFPHRVIQRISACPVCKKQIEKNTLKYSVNIVERGEINVHLSCFKCSECDRLLSPGDRFVIRDDRFACSFHFDRPNRTSRDGSSLADNQRQPTDSSNSDRQSLAESTFRSSNIRLIASQPAPDHGLDNSRQPFGSQLTDHLANHHSDHHPPSDNDHRSIPPNSLNLTDYSNDFDNFESALQANEANDRLYSHEYNLSPNDSNLPASRLLIDSYWPPVSPLNEYENLDAQYVQRKARSKRKKQQSNSSKCFFLVFFL